jgi:hypothetical protein
VFNIICIVFHVSQVSTIIQLYFLHLCNCCSTYSGKNVTLIYSGLLYHRSTLLHCRTYVQKSTFRRKLKLKRCRWNPFLLSFWMTWRLGVLLLSSCNYWNLFICIITEEDGRKLKRNFITAPHEEDSYQMLRKTKPLCLQLEFIHLHYPLSFHLYILY